MNGSALPSRGAHGSAPGPSSGRFTKPPGGAADATARRIYLRVLTWAFTLFNTVRVFAYLPTLWAIHASADSSQHSLWTWLTWLGANVTMAAWLYESNGGRMNRAVLVNIGNAAMCVATVVVIVGYRL